MEGKSVSLAAGGSPGSCLEAGPRQDKCLPRLSSAIRIPSVLTPSPKAFPNVRAVGNDNPQAASQDIVFLAVHPPPAPGAVLGDVKSSLKPDSILISLAPKWTIAKLLGLLNGFPRIARMIPDAPLIVGEGYNPIAYSPSLMPQDRSEAAKARFVGLAEFA